MHSATASVPGFQPPAPGPVLAREPEPIAGLRPLTDSEHTAVAALVNATGVLGLLGFLNSFHRVAETAAPSFGWLAWTVPLGIDLGIAVFSALDIVLARLDMRLAWLRLIPWTLTAATISLNVAGETTLFGIVAHAVLPLLWVVAVEVGAHVLRKRAGLANPTQMDRIRCSRWLLAFPSTLALWRRMVLWEIRSYPGALVRERDRILARTELQDRYGRLWRFKATRRERALYRLGELVPEAVAPAVYQTPIPVRSEPVRPAVTPKREPATATASAGKPGKQPPRRPASPSTDVDDLMPLGWRIAADHAAHGMPLTRDRLREAVRQTGQSLSTDRAGALLARLRSEAPADPVEDVPDRTADRESR